MKNEMKLKNPGLVQFTNVLKAFLHFCIFSLCSKFCVTVQLKFYALI